MVSCRRGPALSYQSQLWEARDIGMLSQQLVYVTMVISYMYLILPNLLSSRKRRCDVTIVTHTKYLRAIISTVALTATVRAPAEMAYSAPSLESRFLEKLVKLIYPLHALELRSQKRIIHTYISLLQCGEGFNLISENLRILWLPQDT